MLLLYSFCLCANYKCPDVLFYFKNCLKTSKFCSSFDLIGINLFHTYHITKLLIIDNNFQINAIWTWKIILSISFNLSYLNIPRDASLRYVLSPDLEDWWNSFLLLLKPRSCNNVFISSVCNFFLIVFVTIWIDSRSAMQTIWRSDPNSGFTLTFDGSHCCSMLFSKCELNLHFLKCGCGNTAKIPRGSCHHAYEAQNCSCSESCRK